MRSLLILFLTICSFSTVYAQGPVNGGASNVTGRISGSVIDSLTKKPVDYATITLYREGSNTPLNGTLTDEKGNFKMDNVVTGNYKVTVSFIGYNTKTIETIQTTPKKPDFQIGKVILGASGRSLNEVSVVGEAAVVENKIDKLVYNAEKDITAAGGNATDLLRKVPLLSVDMDGNVALRGSQNVRVLINGKPSGAMANNLADVLKAIPSDQIKNVEVITSPSAKYDAEGSGGIINIVTKKKDVQGVSGAINASLGTRQNNENANINVKHNRLSVTANVGLNASWPQVVTSNFNSQNLDRQTSSSSIGEARSSRLFYNTSGNVSYDFNDFNSFSTSIRLSQGGFKGRGSSDNINTSPENGVSGALTTINYLANSHNKNRFGGFDWNGDFTHKFAKEGEEISIAGQWSHGKMNTDYTNIYTAFTPNQEAHNNGLNDEFTVQTDYVLPINEFFKIELGGKGIFRKISSTSNFYSPDASGNFIFDTALSNLYDYDQDVYSGYSVLSLNFSKSLAMQIGGRVENTKVDGRPANAGAGVTPYSNEYTNFIPSFVISQALSKTQTLKLSYNKRIQRPSLQFMNPFLNKSNFLNQTQGNPELSPEISQTVELNYSTFIKGSVINASVFYRHTDDIIESYVQTVTDSVMVNGEQQVSLVSRTNFGNIGQNNSVGGSIFGSTTLFKILTLRGSINLNTYKPQTNSTFAQQSINEGTYLNYNGNLGGTLKFKNGFAVETFMFANSPRRTFQGTNPSFSMWVIGMKQEILKKKASIGLNVVEPFSENKSFNSEINTGSLVQSSINRVPFRSFGINFSWNFGKMNFNPQPKKKRGVNNDDMKQGESSQGQMN
jgi:outer membrane receptor for ferrienterochelin and colicin